MLKIAYIGNFRPIHSTENHIKLTLTAMGHTVLPLQEDDLNTDQMLAVIKNNACDLLLYTRTWGLHGDGLELYKQAGIPSASLHLDLYYGLKRGHALNLDPFWLTDYVFTPDGAPDSAKYFKEQGINHFYLKPGVFEQECYLAEQRPEFSQDVIFVGSFEYHKEWPYRKELIKWLMTNYRNFKRYGNPSYDNMDAVTVRNHELNSLYASAKVVVGDSLCLGFNHPYYWSDRVYETLGRGGFLIHPYIEGLQEEFIDRKHLVFYEFGNFEQLKKIINYYIDNPEKREVIRQQGHEFVKANCTYKQRMTEMLNKIAQFDNNIKVKLGGKD